MTNLLVLTVRADQINIKSGFAGRVLYILIVCHLNDLLLIVL